MKSWRTASVSLLSFSSGLPLWLVYIAIPDWMRSVGVDIKTIGLMSLVQLPWAIKIIWAPLLDRFIPPWLGRRRGWIVIAQIALFISTLLLAGVGHHPDTPWVVAAVAMAIAFSSATQDIAVDAYAVEVLHPEEQAVAVGTRTAFYTASRMISGGMAISLAARFSWPVVNFCIAFLYLPFILISILAPEPEKKTKPPRTLSEAVWKPLAEIFSRKQAIEILAFVVLYKLADNLAGALLRPFLVDMGYNADDRGFAVVTVGLIGTLSGTFLGGALTQVLGIGKSLWYFGLLQIISNIGYVVIAQTGIHRPLMYGAMGFESFTSGLGSGAFGVMLMQITQRRFSATQYALFSSLFALARIFSGPVSGFLVSAYSWETFYWLTILMGLPGLFLLHRFVPWGKWNVKLAVNQE